MGSKDKAEKLFAACTDVFVDIVNGLLYRGKKILTEEVMIPGPTESICTGRNGEQSSQFQDYSMFEVRKGEICALYTLENQSCVDRYMPLRCAGYEGAAYRRQYKPENGQGIYPVISLVLNWGENPWTAATSIEDMLDHPVPEGAEDYLNKSRIHVFDMRFLEDAVRMRFEGDVRVVLDYLSDKEGMKSRNQKLRNPEEVMRMLHALSGDMRYLENITFIKEEGRTVCDLLDEMERKGIEKGIQQGIEVLITTCKELGITFEVTSAKLKEKYALGDVEVQQDMKLYW